MSDRLRFYFKAGLKLGLPFLLFIAAQGNAQPPSGFHSIASTCIDLARYDTNRNELTVRFTSGSRERFYRYSSVPLPVWKRMMELGSSGKGVGKYFVDVVVNQPKVYPFVIVEADAKSLSQPKQ